jgi:hypothetical protein
MLPAALLDLGGKLIERLWPDPTQAAQAKLELIKLQQSGELAIIAGQTETNKIEAASPSLFVSGWRPFVGWVCGMALAWHFVLRPIAGAVFVALGHPPPTLPGIDNSLFELLLGMLGLGGLRTVEKLKGAA